ncbi:MAG: XdhC family protein [Ktedonobacteraceae bacterium]
MRDVLTDVTKWRARGEKVAVATVVSMAGSAPHQPDAKLAVSEKGELAGSVSGGCVEPAVVEAALEVIKNGRPQMLEFGISEYDNLAQIGLACGGTIQVFVERLDW